MSQKDQEMASSLVDLNHVATDLALLDVSLGSKTLQLDQSQPPTPDGTGRPVNFQVIAPGLYRSSYPQLAHFETLVELGLKTIVTLVTGPPPVEYHKFMTSHGITHYIIPILANKDPEVYTSDAVVCKVVELMLDPQNYPMLIHCNKGKHRSGCITAAFRKVTGWTLEACIEEYERYSKPKSRDLDKVFIARFDPSPLKHLAIERGYVGGVYRQPVRDSTKSSIYTNNTMETAYTTTDDSVTDLHERVPREHETLLEPAKSQVSF
ncbi:uncharacterized protein Z520_10612 [Fonsecaea multimorphosa CBS 102226]|uniref:diphosphoinositol-polyphosphate diphosphatase n=1 Tax=Fonsecaea multimorphosa CBS 102226 TaxID=1442371 RepID=A0A0D2I949_9EURO|nr:uncharacterized protein Z520_10612 [Fonsecaea multimorphosa CBS 102226]KIX93706.1 hypothetical protein Z520_10612 [Fonsecaea multimorphosa CBS 102226]OAL19815.1 hypothetical protein AYO22_09342 [Fonsecaea multimorphosa]